MPKVPVLKPGDVVRILAALQFREVRQRGSHKQYRHADDEKRVGIIVEQDED